MMNIRKSLLIFSLLSGTMGLHSVNAVDILIGNVTYDVGATTATSQELRYRRNWSGDLVETTVMGQPVVGIAKDAFENCGDP